MIATHIERLPATPSHLLNNTARLVLMVWLAMVPIHPNIGTTDRGKAGPVGGRSGCLRRTYALTSR
jgi:hypothetical protein